MSYSKSQRESIRTTAFNKHLSKLGYKLLLYHVLLDAAPFYRSIVENANV